ncbi:hypothetical protein EM932_06155 [Flavivirga rizhaonensis]|uniref:Uncharacterized protein n=2 Tax=Flavivirga rizhaonensis TaxID=2559571 RepID=A0A4S1DZB8_9FLAO|nr:hypothetical protein EM932_06155 [Flavivirga rizhaonensis]
MFAILLSSFTVNDVTITGYYDNPNITGIETQETECALTGTGALCLKVIGPFESYQLYATDELDTIEDNELKVVIP